MYRIGLVIIGLLVLSLTACTKTISLPKPLTGPDPVEGPIFSTLDFATPLEDQGSGLAVSSSDLYVVGHTWGNLDGVNLGGVPDGFLRRYNGGKLWGLQFGTRSSDFARKVATDSNGDVYVMVNTNGPLGFQVGDWDTFLAKFNKDGERVWTRQFGTENADLAADLAINSNNQIYVLSGEGANNFVVRRFNSGGSLITTKSVTLNNRPGLTPRAIAIDDSNRAIILTDWDNSGNARGRDIRLFKYTPNLNEVWQKNYGTSNNEFANDVTTDSSNNIYFTFSVSSQGGHFIKKNTNGGTVYTRRLEYDLNSSDTSLKSITTDSNNNIYIAGHTLGSFSGFSNAGGADIVVFKYSSSGTEQWVTQFDNGNYGSPRNDFAFDIAVNGAVYITGYTPGNLLTGSSTSYGGNDAYVAQLKKNNGTILGVDQ